MTHHDYMWKFCVVQHTYWLTIIGFSYWRLCWFDSRSLLFIAILQTNIPDFRQTEMEVFRRFSDFLGLHEKLTEKHLHHGCIIPPPPEKSVIGLFDFLLEKFRFTVEYCINLTVLNGIICWF
jgi:hypothetical protein